MRLSLRLLCGLAFVPVTTVTGFLTPQQQQQQQQLYRQKAIVGKRMENRKIMAKSDDDNDNIDDDDDIVDCLVVGGGISGSTLAYNLHRMGCKVVITEARDYLGGNVKSHRTEDGFLWEEGPNSFATQPSIVRIAYQLGIHKELVFADERLPPWVNHNGKLHPLPKGQGGKGPKGQLELVFGPNGVLKFALVGDLLSWPGKIRAGIGAFLGHAPPPPEEEKEETIREWVTRILGEEVYLRCIDPFISGVYAGNPETLGMKAALPKIARIENYSYSIPWNKFGAIFYGGLKRQVELTKERKAEVLPEEWPQFEYGNPGSFRNGLSTLPQAIYKQLTTNDTSRVRLEWKLLKIETHPKNANYYRATFQTNNNNNDDGGGGGGSETTTKTISTKSIVSTIPAHAYQANKHILESLQGVGNKAHSIFTKVREDIDRIGIYYPPVAAVTVAYPKREFQDIELSNGFGNLRDLPGFGNLNPRTEKVRTLGTLWSSSLFPNRCPEDYNLLLNYIGGSRDVTIQNLSEEELLEEVHKGCQEVLLKPNASKPKVIGWKLWPTAIPQYELGHASILKELETEIESKHPGLYICGNYRTGVAFPDCVTFGYEHSKVVKEYLDDLQKREEKEEEQNKKQKTIRVVVRTPSQKKEKKIPFFATLV